MVVNKGRGRARLVEAMVTKVVTDDKVKEGFLPSPLRWTHQPDPVTIRNIQKNQPAYLDLLEYKQEDDKHILRLLSPQIMGLDNLSMISKGKSEVTIALYQASGQIVDVSVSLTWNGKSEPSVLRITQA